MMNKIINWVGGSFFRTIGRLLVYILLGYILALLLSEKNIKLPIFQVLDTYAEEQFIIGDGDYTDKDRYKNDIIAMGFDVITRAESRNCNSSGCNTVINAGVNEFAWLDSGNLTLSNYGVAFQVLANQGVTQNHLYSYSGLYCFRNSLTASGYQIYIYGSDLEAQTTNAGTGLVRLSDVLFAHNVDNGTYSVFSYCYQVQNFFTASGKSAWITQQIKSSSGSNRAVFAGYKLVDLGDTSGLSSSQVSSIINSANSSQTNSINSSISSSTNSINNRITAMEEEVSSSIDEQTQQQQANHEETMNTITDDSINENGVSDFTDGLNKEYSSLTPFSDFLNLPLTWIQSLFASNQNCVPIHLPLPYLNNKYLDLPCMTEFWENMGVLGTLIQVVWIAIVGVRIFNGLFLLTCETIDPNPDKDMTKLRTWEL